MSLKFLEQKAQKLFKGTLLLIYFEQDPTEKESSPQINTIPLKYNCVN